MSWTGTRAVPIVGSVLTTPALLAAVSGLALGLGLIVAIGAQNAFVLRQGLRLEHVAAVVAVCALSDVALILAGVLGAGTVLTSRPWLVPVVCFAGAAFLLGYGLLAARRALRPGTLLAGSAGVRAGLAATVGTCLALTWLNPHVYLDTVVLLGGIAPGFAGAARAAFGGGAVVASFLFFFGLGYGARLLAPLFARPQAWRVLDAGMGVTMWALAAELVAD
jgi:L-lysine exporter family protein LysE/ArgO